MRVQRFQGGWAWKSWNGIESGLVDGEEFDGLGDGRRASPTVRNRFNGPVDSGVGGIGRTLSGSPPC